MKRLTLAATGCALLLAGCGSQVSAGSGHRPAPAPQAAGTTTIPTTTAATTPGIGGKPRHVHHHRHADPGRLPQTHQFPSGHSRRFRHEMADLWSGIAHGQLRPALSAFFPETAYAQVKTITNPKADWQARLLGGFAADIAAAHALLGRAAPRARLIGVHVPAGYAHWVPPGTCANGVGYWEVPNSRVVYREGGQLRSFGIASLISWRGVWYVVHLGAVLRSGSSGVVDDPSSGPGSSAPSSTC